jgi:hypothetical protein
VFAESAPGYQYEEELGALKPTTALGEAFGLTLPALAIPIDRADRLHKAL